MKSFYKIRMYIFPLYYTQCYIYNNNYSTLNWCNHPYIHVHNYIAIYTWCSATVTTVAQHNHQWCSHIHIYLHIIKQPAVHYTTGHYTTLFGLVSWIQKWRLFSFDHYSPSTWYTITCTVHPGLVSCSFYAIPMSPF